MFPLEILLVFVLEGVQLAAGITDCLGRIKLEPRGLPELGQVEAELCRELEEGPGPIRELTSLIRAGGKRIRPQLILYSGLIFSEAVTTAMVRTAVAAELVHTASLIHDDIIDGASFRRHQPSFNQTRGVQISVLAGDYLLARSLGILAEEGLSTVMAGLTGAIHEMCRGEFFQAEERFDSGLTLEAYYQRIAAKTAALFQFCCAGGAIAGGAITDGAAADLLATLREFGLHLGLAFQIRDDLMDWCGEPEQLGKPGHNDISQGTITLPLIFLFQDRVVAGRFKERIAPEGGDASRKISPDLVREIEGWLLSSGAIARTRGVITAHLLRAKRVLQQLPAGRGRDGLSGLILELESEWAQDRFGHTETSRH